MVWVVRSSRMLATVSRRRELFRSAARSKVHFGGDAETNTRDAVRYPEPKRGRDAASTSIGCSAYAKRPRMRSGAVQVFRYDYLGLGEAAGEASPLCFFPPCACPWPC